MGQFDDYEKLAEEIRGCTMCGLCTTRNTVVVDRGDPTAKLMFIGEAPGGSDDVTGQALVGRPGAELDQLLEEAGVEKFIIVNILKCRPPRNKFPGDSESYHGAEVVDICTPWLDKQLALVKPKVIVLVGGKAAAHTIYRGREAPPVKNMVGKRMRSPDYPGVDIFGIYHPSYMLRLKRMNQADYDQIREDTIGLLRNAQSVVNDEPIDLAPVHVSRKSDKGEQLNFF